MELLVLCNDDPPLQLLGRVYGLAVVMGSGHGGRGAASCTSLRHFEERRTGVGSML